MSHWGSRDRFFRSIICHREARQPDRAMNASAGVMDALAFRGFGARYLVPSVGERRYLTLLFECTGFLLATRHGLLAKT
jgi:hypothetical protein